MDHEYEIDTDLVEVTIELTDKCQFNCNHCSTKHSEYYRNSKILTEDEIIDRAIKFINSSIYVRVRFSGGEPLLVLNDETFKKIRKLSCVDIDRWIITTNGSSSTDVIKNLVLGLKKDNFDLNRVVFRVSLYGNNKQHTKITRSSDSYDNAINNIKWMVDNRINVEITTPVHGFLNLLNVVMIAKKYKVPLRLTRLIFNPSNEMKTSRLSPRTQLIIAKTIKLLYKRVYLTCSLYNICDKGLCDYKKYTILANGKVIGCAINKLLL